ncbi:MAG: hypothetical protein QOG50_1998, partial [Actinomycetota bacterium]|nr:hypothetical protein [Actinomycetota bacterium]
MNPASSEARGAGAMSIDDLARNEAFGGNKGRREQIT